MIKDTILIADDEPEILRQIQDTCIENGYRTICANNGLEAWEQLFQNSDEIVACVIDLQMPPGTHGGKDLAIKVRRCISTTLPIVIFSGRGTISLSHEVTKVGADAFVEKEAGMQQLIDVVARLISEKTKPFASVPSSLSELASSADLPSIALRSSHNLERFVRTTILPKYTPQELCSLFAKRCQEPPPHVMDRLKGLTDFSNEKKLSFGDLYDILTALSACQLHGLPPPSAIRRMKGPIVEVRNDLSHGREVTARRLIEAIICCEDLLEQSSRQK